MKTLILILALVAHVAAGMALMAQQVPPNLYYKFNEASGATTAVQTLLISP